MGEVVGDISREATELPVVHVLKGMEREGAMGREGRFASTKGRLGHLRIYQCLDGTETSCYGGVD